MTSKERPKPSPFERLNYVEWPCSYTYPHDFHDYRADVHYADAEVGWYACPGRKNKKHG